MDDAGIYNGIQAEDCVIGVTSHEGSAWASLRVVVVVSSNSGNGIYIGGTGVRVFNTLVGVDVNGSTALPNGGNGVHIADTACESAINGSTISGNRGSGIYMRGTNTTITGNTIGPSISTS